MSKNKSKTTTNSEVETRLFHERYLRAVNNPLRRQILVALNKGSSTIHELATITGLADLTLRWHLSILEYGFCIEKQDNQGILVYTLTQEGKVVNYIK